MCEGVENANTNSQVLVHVKVYMVYSDTNFRDEEVGIFRGPSACDRRVNMLEGKVVCEPVHMLTCCTWKAVRRHT